MEESPELDLATASSAVEAQDILEKRKIDVVIMDINMPQMSGLELYDIIRERWPYCKVIFLTGYSDFDYVYKVHKHAKYVLKAEDDDKILEAAGIHRGIGKQPSAGAAYGFSEGAAEEASGA